MDNKTWNFPTKKESIKNWNETSIIMKKINIILKAYNWEKFLTQTYIQNIIYQ